MIDNKIEECDGLINGLRQTFEQAIANELKHSMPAKEVTLPFSFRLYRKAMPDEIFEIVSPVLCKLGISQGEVLAALQSLLNSKGIQLYVNDTNDEFYEFAGEFNNFTIDKFNKIKLTQIDVALDGGTICFEDKDRNLYYQDYRINTKTPGALFDRYPAYAGAKMLDLDKFEFRCINCNMNTNRQYAGQSHQQASAMSFREIMEVISRPAVVINKPSSVQDRSDEIKARSDEVKEKKSSQG